MTEQQLGRAVCLYLEDLGFECYKEVQSGYGKPIIDIVAKRGPVLWVVECKTAFNATVVAQAWRSTHDAHFVSIAVPWVSNRNHAVKQWLLQTCQDQGIGIITVTESYFDENDEYTRDESQLEVKERQRPKFRRMRRSMIAKHLDDGHKWFAEAGNAKGLRWSPFRKTCHALKAYVERNPGCTLKEAIDKIDHHYQGDGSAKGNLYRWIRLGKVPGLRLDRTVRPARLYLTDADRTEAGIPTPRDRS